MAASKPTSQDGIADVARAPRPVLTGVVDGVRCAGQLAICSQSDDTQSARGIDWEPEAVDTTRIAWLEFGSILRAGSGERVPAHAPARPPPVGGLWASGCRTQGTGIERAPTTRISLSRASPTKGVRAAGIDLIRAPWSRKGAALQARPCGAMGKRPCLPV